MASRSPGPPPLRFKPAAFGASAAAGYAPPYTSYPYPWQAASGISAAVPDSKPSPIMDPLLQAQLSKMGESVSSLLWESNQRRYSPESRGLVAPESWNGCQWMPPSPRLPSAVSPLPSARCASPLQSGRRSASPPGGEMRLETLLSDQVLALEKAAMTIKVLNQDMQTLAEALARQGARVFNWSADLTRTQRQSLAEVLLSSTQPCAHIDVALTRLCGELKSAIDGFQSFSQPLPKRDLNAGEAPVTVSEPHQYMSTPDGSASQPHPFLAMPGQPEPPQPAATEHEEHKEEKREAYVEEVEVGSIAEVLNSWSKEDGPVEIDHEDFGEGALHLAGTYEDHGVSVNGKHVFVFHRPPPSVDAYLVMQNSGLWGVVLEPKSGDDVGVLAYL